MKHNLSRFVCRASVVVCAVACMLPIAGDCHAREWDSTEHNCMLIIPDEPAQWEWLNYDPAWKSRNIIRGAKRTVEKLKNGSSGAGYGGLLHLAKRDAPEGMTLESAAADTNVRNYMLVRFGNAASKLSVEEEDVTILGDHPAKCLRVSGKAKGPGGKKPVDCRGVLLITMAKGKLYLLRMYAWHTEADEEGIKNDLDTIEYEGLEILDTKEATKKDAGQPTKPENGDKEDDEKEDEDLKEEFIENEEQKWSITKHKLLREMKITKADRKRFVVLRFGHVDDHGWHQMELYAIPNSRVVNGQQAPPEDLRGRMTKDWYKKFLKNHPVGEIARYKWPKPSKRTFITLPHYDRPDDRIVVFDGKKKKRDPDASTGDVMKRLKVVEKVKRGFIGKRFKASEAFRGNMQGNRERAGMEWTSRFAWRTPKHSFRLIVSMTRDAYKKYGEPLRQTMESFEIHK